MRNIYPYIFTFILGVLFVWPFSDWMLYSLAIDPHVLTAMQVAEHRTFAFACAICGLVLVALATLGYRFAVAKDRKQELNWVFLILTFMSFGSIVGYVLAFIYGNMTMAEYFFG